MSDNPEHSSRDGMMSQDEAWHLVAREVAKQRMADMERKINENDSKTSIVLTDIKMQMAQVIEMIKQQTQKQEENKKELKKEIEKEFASKIELERLENKLDKLFLKITVTVGTLVAIGAVGSWILTAANGFKTLAGH